MMDDRSGNTAHPRTHGNTPGDTRCAPTLTASRSPSVAALSRAPPQSARGGEDGGLYQRWGGGGCFIRGGSAGSSTSGGGRRGPSSGEVREAPEMAAAGAAAFVGRVARGLGPGGLT